MSLICKGLRVEKILGGRGGRRGSEGRSGEGSETKGNHMREVRSYGKEMKKLRSHYGGSGKEGTRGSHLWLQLGKMERLQVVTIQEGSGRKPS